MTPIPGKDPPKTMYLDKYTLNTDLDQFSDMKKSKLFDEVAYAISSSKGTLSVESRKLVSQMAKYFKSAIEEKNKLKDERVKLTQENSEVKATLSQLENEIIGLKSPAIPSYAPTSTYASVVQNKVNKKPEFTVLVKYNDPSKDKKDMRKDLFHKLRSIEDKIDVLDTKVRNETLVVQVSNETQQQLINSKLNEDHEQLFNSDKPKKRIPSIKIYDVEPEMREEDILSALKRNENINSTQAKVKIILKNPRFKTNRVVIDLNEEDTMRISKQERIKMGCKMHRFEIDYNIIQCKQCNKFGHFHKAKDGTVKCKSQQPTCVHCGRNHELKDCPDSQNRQRAKCSNCGQNHRAYDGRCSKRHEVIQKVKEKFLC